MINIFCALKCEATPLLDFFELSHCVQSSPFPVYTDKKQEVSLTITGIGKLSAAAAVIHVQSLFELNDHDICLNIGIAGHMDYPVGELRLANRIEDADSGECWYPQIVIDTHVQSAGLLSLSKPSVDYCGQMYDMEASGFYHSTSLFGTAELCQSIKVISDNQDNPADRLVKKEISELIAKNLTPISSVANKLSELARELPVLDISTDYGTFMENWHFTHYERNTLKQLLQRWQILLPESPPWDCVANAQSGKEVLKKLAQNLDEVPTSYV